TGCLIQVSGSLYSNEQWNSFPSLKLKMYRDSREVKISLLNLLPMDFNCNTNTLMGSCIKEIRLTG
ncbi:MAG TPA: hypothetical protein VLS45_00895, partial [Methylomicrobium sp.]|nr:hypothetical protein [Methylomicrobium sp.]